MIYPLLPVFLSSITGLGVVAVGIVEGVAEATSSLLKLISGALSDKIKRKKELVIAGYTIATFSRPLIGITTRWWQVLLIRFGDRVGKGIRTSPRDSLIAYSSPQEARGLAFGFHRAMDHIGAVVGPLVAFALMGCLGVSMRGVFLLAVIPGIITLSVLALGVREPKTPVVNKKPLSLSFRGFSKEFYRFVFILFLFTLGNSTDAFLLLKAQSAGISIAFIPLLWGVLHTTKSIASIPGGALSDKIGRKTTIILGWAVYGVVYTGFALASSPLGIWCLFLLYGVYFGFTEGVEKAMIADLAEEDSRGRAYGIYHFLVGIGSLLASFLFAFLWKTFNPQTAFFTGAGLAITASFLLLLLVKEGKTVSYTHLTLPTKA